MLLMCYLRRVTFLSAWSVLNYRKNTEIVKNFLIPIIGLLKV